MDGTTEFQSSSSRWIFHPPEVVQAKQAAIHASVLGQSSDIQRGNFAAISVDDLHLLFDQYNRQFFDSRLTTLLADRQQAQLSFRLSRRMTRVGGTTASFRRTGASRHARGDGFDYEITISTTLLFQSFHDLDRTVAVNGLSCRDRLEALQRVFEHELVHLLEMLSWGDSSCTAPRFSSLAGGLFTHTQTTHDLVTQRERAHATYGVRVGDWVQFEIEGRAVEGVVNRITRRATVLVLDPHGRRYSDGKRYLKFYVPLPLLKKK